MAVGRAIVQVRWGITCHDSGLALYVPRMGESSDVIVHSNSKGRVRNLGRDQVGTIDGTDHT